MLVREILPGERTVKRCYLPMLLIAFAASASSLLGADAAVDAGYSAEI